MQRSMVAGVAKTSPLNPCFSSNGRRPEWSMWPWVSTTALMDGGSKGKGRRLSASSSGEPCIRPQSIKTVKPESDALIGLNFRESEVLTSKLKKMFYDKEDSKDV